MQFVKLFNLHKNRKLTKEQLHWGEEIEYHLYTFNEENKQCQLSCDADDILTEFSEDNQLKEKSEKPDFVLMPEFGNWMIEAVPAEPYGTYSDPAHLLSCYDKIASR